MSYLSECLADAPSLLWLLNEAAGTAQAADSSGNSRPSTSKGASVAFGAAGLIAGHPTAASFTGSGTANLISAALPARTDGTPYSIEVWVKTVTATPARVAAGDNGTSAATSRGVLFAPTGSGFAAMQVTNTGSTGVNAIGSVTINNGQPHHLVGTFGNAGGSNAARIYVDGLLGATSAVAGTARALATMRGGGTSAPGVDAFSGTAAGLAYYPTELSAARVAAHYTAGFTAPRKTIRTAGGGTVKTRHSGVWEPMLAKG